MSLIQQTITAGNMKLWHYYSQEGLIDLSGNGNDGVFVNSPFINRDGVNTNGTDNYIQVADDPSLSFGNGTTDSGYTFIVRIKNLATTGFLLHKTEDSSTPANLEYVLRIDNSQRILVRNYDASTAGYIGEYADAAEALKPGLDYTLAVTYDGSSTSAGFTLYVNGLEIVSAANESGAYTAMEDLNKNLGIGRYASSYSKNTFEHVMIIADELTATEIAQLTGELASKIY